MSGYFATRMRARGVKVGERLNTRQMPFVECVPNSRIEIGDDCILVHTTKQNPAGVVHRTAISTSAVGAVLTIGNRVRMSGAFIVAALSIRIGDNVMLGANVKIYDNDFHPLDFGQRMRDDPTGVLCAPVVVERGAWIGADAVLLKGAHVGEFAIVGARSVVTGQVPRCTVYAGNPARFIKNLPEPADFDTAVGPIP